MSEYPLKPLRVCFDLDRHIDSVFQDLILRPWGFAEQSTLWQPDIDLYDTDGEYVVEADLPGVSSENVRVNIEPHAVTISGSREATAVGRTAQGLRIERRQGEFSRRFHLDTAVDPKTVEHDCVEGLHRIRLRKRSN